MLKRRDEDPDLIDEEEYEAGPPRRRWRWLVWGAAGAIVVFVALCAWLFFTAPLGKALEPLADSSLVITSADGTPIARRGGYKAEPVEVAKLPRHMIDAMLSIEDRRFYSHLGIDPQGIARALFSNVRAGDVVQGGSSITQQLAKTSFLTLDRSLKRKVQEVLIAFWLEAWLTKDEILSRYLSSVYFGDGAYGLRAAARTYFSTTPERLTLGQAAMLAGLVKAPSRLAPSSNLEGAQARARVVLAAMVDNGKLTAAEARAVRLPGYTPGRRDLPTGSYFADWVLPQARDALTSGAYGEVTVRTTLDDRLQADAERIIARALDGPGTWLGAKEAALVAMRPNGEVVAMVGGRDYARNQFNRATQARRQPGSTFKLFVYLAALRNGWTLDSRIDDTRFAIGDYSPENDEGKYRGDISLVTAFAASSNVAAVKLAQAVGAKAVIDEARRLGVRSYINPWPSMALGTSPMPLLELTSAYAAMASGRYPVAPTGLQSRQEGWVANAGRVVSILRPWPEREPMLRLLETVIRNGTGSSARLPITAYGKTGTTQNHRDALFVGWAGDLVVGVWVGNDDNSPMNGVSGRGLPAEIWRDFMRAALAREGRIAEPARPALDIRIPDEAAAALDAAADAVQGAAEAVSDAAGEPPASPEPPAPAAPEPPVGP